MTIQEQLIILNTTFENLHKEFVKADSDKRNLSEKYARITGDARNNFQKERQKFIDIKEEVLKYYRIAKDNSSRELFIRSASPMKPDLRKLNSLIEKIDVNNRNDYTAGQIIDLAGSYCAYLDNEIGKITVRENQEINRIAGTIENDEKDMISRKKMILHKCEQYLQGDDMKNLVSLFEMIHHDYEITPEFFSQFGNQVKRKRMMLLGFSQYYVDVPGILKPVLKKSLGHHFDENRQMVNCPCGFTTNSHEEIFVEYTDLNETELKSGIQALILNFLRYFRPRDYRISLLDYIHYNSDILGPLSVFTGAKKGIIDTVPYDAASLKQGIAMLAGYYRKIENKIGAGTVYDYNRTHAPEERIPLRILIINRIEEKFRMADEPEMSYLINNAQKFGITTIRMTKSMDGGSIGKDREKKYLAKAKNLIRVISDSHGSFYIENDIEWMLFKWLSAPSSLPDSFVSKIQDAVKPVETGTKYFKRYKFQMPVRSKDKRKPVSVPFAVDEDDRPVKCSFENEMFAAYINGAAGSGKSTLLHTIICGLVMNYHPDELELWLMDFKMTELKKYADHRPPHIKYLLLEKSADLVFDILDRLDEEMSRRKFVFSQNGWHKLPDVPPTVYMPVIFVIIDEFAQMSQILRDTKGSGVGSDYAMKLENILREGRAVGFKFIFSSQTYSDGVEGLTESARKQIQQRLALKNTYMEIKDTLALPTDAISPVLQNTMNTLPPYESLFKWTEKNTDGSQVLRVEHLRNMYAEDMEVDQVVDKISSGMTAVKRINPDSEKEYVEKKPILIDGAVPKTFKSQIPYYKGYETPEILENLEDEDVLVYAGVPCSFNLAKPFMLSNIVAENMLIVGGSRENELNVILSVFCSYSRKGWPIEIWSHGKNPLYKRYKETILKRYNKETDLAAICSRITDIKSSVQKQKCEQKLILILGYERIAADLEILGMDAQPPEPHGNDKLEEPEDMTVVLAKIRGCSDPEEKKRIRADYNARVAAYQKQQSEAQEGDAIYDARKDLEWIVKRASNNGIHFMFAFENAGDFLDTRLEPKAFRHKIVFSMAKDDSLNIIGNRRANELDTGYCAYTNGKDFFTMRPHIYKGIPCNGWQIDDQGNIVQRR